MDLNKKEIVISEGKRPFWQIIIAALLFTATLFILFYFFYALYIAGNNPSLVKKITSLLHLSVYTFLSGLSFSLVKTIYINLEKEKLKTEYSIGIIKINYHSTIPELEYVSVYKNPQTYNIEVNLWYKGNKHFNVFNFDEEKQAFEFGLQFSNKLNIDLLDATEERNFKWVDKTKL